MLSVSWAYLNNWGPKKKKQKKTRFPTEINLERSPGISKFSVSQMVLIYSGDWNQGTTNIQRKVCSLREWRTNMPFSGSCSFQTSRGPPSTCSTWSPLSWHRLLPKVNRSSSHPWICLNTFIFCFATTERLIQTKDSRLSSPDSNSTESVLQPGQLYVQNTQGGLPWQSSG